MKSPLLAVLALALICSSGAAQSPGSIESELNYAREYLDAGKWDYAMWGYEGVLRRDPENAEARDGYAKAKAEYEARKAAQAAQAKALAAPRPAAAASPAAPRRQSKPVKGSRLSGQAECDRLFGACWVTSKSPNCFVQKRMCYNRNGVK